MSWVMGLICLELVHGFDVTATNILKTNLEKFRYVPLKDCKFRYISLLSHLHMEFT
jgi:hypothetical protein